MKLSFKSLSQKEGVLKLRSSKFKRNIRDFNVFDCGGRKQTENSVEIGLFFNLAILLVCILKNVKNTT